jgi:hypothetical protein
MNYANKNLIGLNTDPVGYLLLWQPSNQQGALTQIIDIERQK